MTRAPRGPRRWSPGTAVLLGAVFVTAAAVPTPASARAHFWGGSLLLVSILAGVLLLRTERRAGALEDAYRGALDLTAGLIDSVERHSENHSRRVAESAVEMAMALDLSGAQVEDVRIAALLHDLARLDIPAESLAQAAGIPLEVLAESGAGGRSRIRPVRAGAGTLRQVIPIVACCRERWDGTGRRALGGEEIPLGARIIAVADAYDTIVTDRAYQKGCSREEALDTIEEASATQFDPRVVDVFLRLHGTWAGTTDIPKAA